MCSWKITGKLLYSLPRWKSRHTGRKTTQNKRLFLYLPMHNYFLKAHTHTQVSSPRIEVENEKKWNVGAASFFKFGWERNTRPSRSAQEVDAQTLASGRPTKRRFLLVGKFRAHHPAQCLFFPTTPFRVLQLIVWCTFTREEHKISLCQSCRNP